MNKVNYSLGEYTYISVCIRMHMGRHPAHSFLLNLLFISFAQTVRRPLRIPRGSYQDLFQVVTIHPAGVFGTYTR